MVILMIFDETANTASLRKDSRIDVQQSGQEHMQHVTGLKDHPGEEEHVLQFTGMATLIQTSAKTLHW